MRDWQLNGGYQAHGLRYHRPHHPCPARLLAPRPAHPPRCKPDASEKEIASFISHAQVTQAVLGIILDTLSQILQLETTLVQSVDVGCVLNSVEESLLRDKPAWTTVGMAGARGMAGVKGMAGARGMAVGGAAGVMVLAPARAMLRHEGYGRSEGYDWGERPHERSFLLALPSPPLEIPAPSTLWGGGGPSPWPRKHRKYQAPKAPKKNSTRRQRRSWFWQRVRGMVWLRPWVHRGEDDRSQGQLESWL